MPLVALVGYYIDWSGSVGARRAEGLARYLPRHGWDVVSIGARPPDPPSGATGPPSGETGSTWHHVTTPHGDRVRSMREVAAKATRGRSAREARPVAPSDTNTNTDIEIGSPRAADPRPNTARRASDAARRGARRLALFPDGSWEWQWVARRAIRHDHLLQQADVVLVTVPPLAGLGLAGWLGRRLDRPVVGDFRDLWVDDPHRDIARLLQPLDRRWQRRALASLAAATTVAEPLSTALAAHMAGRTVRTIPNGFDPSWVRHDTDTGQSANTHLANTHLTVCHTGTFGGSTGRTVQPVLDLLDVLELDTSVVVRLVGWCSSEERRRLETHPRRSRVILTGALGADDVRREQHRADVLLSLGSDDPAMEAECPAKLFEYAAARRPVLQLGGERTLGARLVLDNGLGWVVPTRDRAAAAVTLRRLHADRTIWMPPPLEALAPLSQVAMAERMAEVLDDVRR